MIIEKLTEGNLLAMLDGKSAITFDIAPLHTGIVEFDGVSPKEYFFHLTPQSSDDVFKEIKQRRDFKSRVEKIVSGKHYDYCLVEGVYGGENYNTLVQLLNLNTVVDELILDGVCTVDTFYRQKQVEWASDTRQIYKQAGKPTSKVETQGLLEYLGCKYYLDHKNDSTTQKKEECFEDICDAYGMLYSIVAKVKAPRSKKERGKITIKDVRMSYVSSYDELDTTSRWAKRFADDDPLAVDLDYKHLEESIITQATLHPDRLLMAVLPSSELGIFGVKHNFTFCADEDEGLLYFYNRRG